ncbi:branched-chain-amino-acid aminotransferase 5 [Exophiala viscosa]|uniref:Branched-chain-amino-acid aminotransferase 5 n=1 Tax=Exophiala viscosa TaxID=2486360 RepID=A0AAN6IDF6_9EURO|nr:branched-chain-amino-acid aminotransferase 5 [Exophiala viscosa]KAI1626475.1 branched-chain-amino-acid aminotransferase 5 [Exophiala viscosa]
MAIPPPLAHIDWSKLGLSVNDSVNGHVEATFTVESGSWSAPRLVSDPYLRIHGLSPALNYGMQAYEGLKAVRTPSNKITIFRPSFHWKRLNHSAETVSMPPLPESLFMQCINDAVVANAGFVGPADSNAVLYIRPVLFGSGAQLALEPPSTFTFAVYVQPATTYHGVQPLPCLVMEDFDRTATRGTGHAKIGGNYAPAIKWSRAAKQKGYYMTLHLDSATQSEIDEFSTSGFVGVIRSAGSSESDTDGGADKGTLVVPDSKQIIDSVTSDSIRTIARSLGYKVEVRPVKYAELSRFSEVLAVGTAASVLPIAAIVRESTGDKFVYCPAGKPGPAAVELGAAITACIRGRADDPHGWLYQVPFPEPPRRAPPKLNTLSINGEGNGPSEEELSMLTSPI